MKANDKSLKTEDVEAVNALIEAEEAQLALAEAEELQNKLELFKEWHKKNVPGIPYEVLENIILTYDNQKAWGVFENGVAKFFKLAKKGTEYHEIFEAIWASFLTKEQQQVVLEEERNKPGSFKDRESGKIIKYDEATDYQLKEKIADDFADFRLGKIKVKSLSDKITSPSSSA